jgi:hypothetical protein
MKRSKFVSVALNGAAFVLITGAFFVVLEGLSSTLIAVIQVLEKPETEASRYDADVGWVGLPNANIPNMYGRHTSRWAGCGSSVLATHSPTVRESRIITRGVTTSRNWTSDSKP